MGRNDYSRGRRMTRRQRQKQLIRRAFLALGIGGVGLVLVIFACSRLFLGGRSDSGEGQEKMTEEDWIGAPELDVELLDVNEYSRPGTPLEQINGIVVHYTANPGSSAMANRD